MSSASSSRLAVCRWFGAELCVKYVRESFVREICGRAFEKFVSGDVELIEPEIFLAETFLRCLSPYHEG
jgi:hypothetical protein